VKPPSLAGWRRRLPEPWTPPQRRVLIVLLLVLLISLAVRYWFNPSFVSDPQPRFPARYFDLADRIDPNVADWQTLAALPNIGEKRAQEIVAYRQRVMQQRPQAPAFARADDLLRVRGIGPSIVSQLQPYLIFPRVDPAATTSLGSD
jgi:hypothetical protein